VAAAPSPERAPRAGPALALLLCLGAAVLAYRPSIPGEFQFDDWATIATNRSLRDPAAVRAIRVRDLLGPDRRVTHATFLLDHAIGGLDPAQYHRTSLALHLVAGCLAFALAAGCLRRAGASRPAWVAAAAAGAFVLHPLQTQAVAYAAQRSEVLAAVFGLGSLLALVAASDRWPRPAAWALVAAASALHLLALGSKSIAIAFPAVFVLCAVVVGDPRVPRATARLARAAALSAPLWVLSLASTRATLTALSGDPMAGVDAGTIGPWRYLLTQLRVHWLYARLVAWPAGQNVEHVVEPSPGLLHGPTLVALAATVALCAGAVVLWALAERGKAGAWARVAAFGVLSWYAVLAPTSSVVPIADLAVEHRAYLASAFLLLAVGGLALGALERLASRRAVEVAGILAVALLGALGLATHARAEVWRTQLGLWSDAAAKSPASARAQSNLAFALQARGDVERAGLAYLRAAELARTPGDVAGVARNLSALLLDAGQPALALAAVERGLATVPSDPNLLHNRAAALWRLGRIGDALRELDAVIATSPAPFPKAHDTRGRILAGQGDLEAALRDFRAARAVDPADPAYAEHELVVLAALQRLDAACRVWGEIVAAGTVERVTPRARQIAAELRCGSAR
jgi:tetratricopeptide (TPR) repeat protein